MGRGLPLLFHAVEDEQLRQALKKLEDFITGLKVSGTIGLQKHNYAFFNTDAPTANTGKEYVSKTNANISLTDLANGAALKDAKLFVGVVQ